MPRTSLPISKLCVVIPAFNEAKSLGWVVRSVRKQMPRVMVVVVNDGSTDTTQSVADSLGVKVIRLAANLGIGASVQTGIKFAFRNHFDYVMQVDGDGQHDPKFMKPLFTVAVREKIDLTIGSRYLGATSYSIPWLRSLGIKIFSESIRLATGVTIGDATSGFRVFGPRILPYLAQNYPIDFPEPESIVRLLTHGYKVKEVSVEMRSRRGGVSSVDAIKAVYLMLSIPLAIGVEMLRPKMEEFDAGR